MLYIFSGIMHCRFLLKEAEGKFCLTILTISMKPRCFPCLLNYTKMSFALSEARFTQHRNQRMAEDQSVVGRRQIYYDPCGSETLICSDSEEDIAETDGEKHEFSKGEDHMLW